MRSLCLIAALSCASPLVRADDVTLKDGTVHKDLTLVKETERMLEFLTLDGKKISFNKEKVASHERKPTPRDEYTTKKAAVKPRDAAGLYEVAAWAKANGLVRDARADFEQVLKFDPGHAGAHEALGHKLHEGKWLNETEYKKAAAAAMEVEAKAKGWKKWKDTWVPPLQYARLEKDLVEVTDPEHGVFWVTKDIQQKIEKEKWTWCEGEWVSPADREKLDGGMRQFKGRWLKIEDLDPQFSSLQNPWVLKSKHFVVMTNAAHQRAKAFVKIAEDCYVALEQVFGGEHSGFYDGEGRLLLLIGKGISEYKLFGQTFDNSDRVRKHVNKFGAFFAPEAEIPGLEGKDKKRRAACTYDVADGDFDWTRSFIGHAIAHAYLDRFIPEESHDEKLQESMAAYISATHKGRFAPTWWYYQQFIGGRDVAFSPAHEILDRVAYDDTGKRLGQAAFMMHYLREKNPDAFCRFWQAHVAAGPDGSRKAGLGSVSGKGASTKTLLEACLGKADESIQAGFAAFLEQYKKDFRPWDKS